MMVGMSLMLGEPPEVDPKNRDRAETYWMYGASAEELGKAWDKPTDVAALKTCGNCEYFDNRIQTLKALKIESGTGACTKFNFVCSQEKACQGWDSQDKNMMEED
jgi:predicted metal-binding protein